MRAIATASTGRSCLGRAGSTVPGRSSKAAPRPTAVAENLTEAGHHAGVGAFVADAGYWTAANGTVDVGAEVLIATRKTAWRKADKPDDDKLTVLAKVNRGELSQRQADEILRFPTPGCGT